MISGTRLITRSLLVLAIVLSFSSCIRENELVSDRVQIIAHRGYHITLLENTTESFEAAYQKEFRHLELDIFFTKDFQPVVIHDKDLDSQSDTTGSINDMYLADVKKIRLNNNYKIPIFEEVLRDFGSKFETIFIDLKEPCPDSGLKNFDLMINKHNLYTRTITTGTIHETVRKLKEIDSNLQLGTDGENFEDELYECIQQKYKHVLVPYDQLNNHLCYIAKANKIKVYAYTPNSEQQMLQSLRYNIDGIMTDYPDLLRQMIK
ncbi:MAG: glycerophosphoryl diester phosphodiesterase [Ignavibacteria bacterium]|nr:glycerophosphoryl diester phosphodiesterase [Ignavibacteria bacterium]